MTTNRRPWLIVVVRDNLAWCYGSDATAAVSKVTTPLYVWRKRVTFPAESVPDLVAYAQSRGELIVVHEKTAVHEQ